MKFSSASASYFDGDDEEGDSTYTPESANSPGNDTNLPGGKQKRKSTRGRTLQRWDPSKDQFVLLCVENYVANNGIPFDWNEVARLIAPTVTGEAIKQHLTKVRRAREKAKQQVPPSIGRDHRARRKNNKNSALVAPTKTPRRSQAPAEEGDPFADFDNQTAAPKNIKSDDQQNDDILDSKLAGLIYQKPVKTRVSRIKAEEDQTPASTKRKTTDESSTLTKKPRGKKQKPRESSFKTGLETDHLRTQVEMSNNFDTAEGTPATPQSTPAKIQQGSNSKIRAFVAGFRQKNLDAANQQDGQGTPFGNGLNYAQAEKDLVEDDFVNITSASATDRAIKMSQFTPPPVDNTVAGNDTAEHAAATPSGPDQTLFPLFEDLPGPSTTTANGIDPNVTNGALVETYHNVRPISPAPFSFGPDFYPMGEAESISEAELEEIDRFFHAPDGDVFPEGLNASAANVGYAAPQSYSNNHVGAADWTPLPLTQERVAEVANIASRPMTTYEYFNSGYGDGHYLNKKY